MKWSRAEAGSSPRIRKFVTTPVRNTGPSRVLPRIPANASDALPLLPFAYPSAAESSRATGATVATRPNTAGTMGVRTTPLSRRAITCPRWLAGNTRRSINAARNSKPDEAIAALTPRAATAVIQAELVNPVNARAGDASPVIDHATTRASATAKSGTGSMSQAIAPPAITATMCQPTTLRPAGAGRNQSPAATAMEAAIDAVRVIIERYGGGGAAIGCERSSAS